MSTSFVATSYSASASADELTPAVPTGTQDDDILCMIAYSDQGYPSSTPSGWTQLGLGNSNYALYYKIASSESGTYTVDFSSSGNCRVQIAAWRGGFDTDDPIDVVSNTAFTTNSVTVRAASMTVTAADSTLLYFGADAASAARTFNPPTNPGAFTEDVDDGDTASDVYFCIARYEWSSSGATSNIDAWTSVATTTKHAFAVALNPAPADNVGNGLFDLHSF